jgi:hypothetical protein
MSIDTKAVKTWTAEQMFKEFVQRQVLLESLGGWLYRGIVGDEMCVIEEACIELYKCPPVSLIAENVITASRTDESGVVHSVVTPCHPMFRGLHMSPTVDTPGNPITCLLCLVG